MTKLYKSRGFKVLEITATDGKVHHLEIYPSRESAQHWLNSVKRMRPTSIFEIYRSENSVDGDLSDLLDAVTKVGNRVAP